MKQDPIIFGGIAGIIGTIAKEILDFIFVAIGFSKYSYWNIAASLFILPKDVNRSGGWILGALTDIIASAVFGVILLYVIKFTGRKYLYIKGIGFGWFIWVLFFGVVINLHVVRITPTDIGTSLSSFFEHLIFGLTTAWGIHKFASDSIESK